MISTTADAPARIAARLLAGPGAGRESLHDYQSSGGYDRGVWRLSPAALAAEVNASGLRGRGGAAFPAGPKWHAVAVQPGRKVVLVNAAESEPGSAKDRLLLVNRPHLVLEGALLAARVVGADELVIYLHEGERGCRDALETSLAELRSVGWTLPRWRFVEAPPRYVSGEETAAVQRINGGPAKPTFKQSAGDRRSCTMWKPWRTSR
jgi:NADH:ubiquinone oxidoreductase subunit F (NADH-binding)